MILPALNSASRKMKKIIGFIFVTLLFASAGYSQQPVPAQEPATDTLKVVDILNADRFSFKKTDSLNEFQMMAGNVRLKQGNTIFSSDSAVYNKATKVLEAFGNIHINDNDSVHTYSQYLLYHVDTRIATLTKKVRLTDRTTQLFTEELEYDMNQKIGIYRKGGRVVNKNSVLTSREATYYSDLKDVYFRQNVKLKDPDYDLEADSLLYNTNSQIATFITRTIIKDSTRRIETTDGYYDLQNKNAYFGKRPIIKDGAVTIIANEVETDDRTGVSILIGNAVFKDTAQGISILANYIESNKADESFFATQRPLMILKQDQDSIYVTGDTLYSGRLSKLKSKTDQVKKDTTISLEEISKSPIEKDSTQNRSVNDTLINIDVKDTILNAVAIDSSGNDILPDSSGNKKISDSADRYFQVYRNVRIFSDSLQAVCDSLFYNGVDSVFQLFTQPIVWASGSQVTGDTILLYTKNKKADRMLAYENGMLINKAAEGMFNQISGNTINGYFVEGNIEQMRAKGNAESIYYAKDDKEKFIGVNRASGDIIDMRFLNKELERVVFISEVKGTMYPIRQMPETERTLRNFNWQENKRPKSKFELMGE
jgi:lipopolysaccharide export system protein LptA